MDPFGNFGWNFGFGFGWILTGIVAILMVVAIVQLVRFGFGDEKTKAEEEARLKSLKEAACENRISLEEFKEAVKGLS